MKTVLITFLLCIQIIISGGQSKPPIKTKEVKQVFANGYIIFHICENNPVVNYDDNKEYNWYSVDSKTQKTKGGSGGSLLHGNKKFYNNDGSLSLDENYYMGLLQGSAKSWKNNEIEYIRKYNKGEISYGKERTEDGSWVETFYEDDWSKPEITRWYSNYNILKAELKNNRLTFRTEVKEYYEMSTQIAKKFTKNSFDGLVGKYIEYYENGTIKVEGQYADMLTGKIKDGIWKYYNKDGSIEGVSNFRVEKEKSQSGAYIQKKDGSWVKHGKWTFYNKETDILTEKEYNFGVEIN